MSSQKARRTKKIDETKLANDPIHQFQITKILPLEVLGQDISFTNSSLFMVLTLVVSTGFLVFTTSGRGLIPGRLQSISEMAYEFVANLLRDSAGSEGMKFFPLVFSLFVFILVSNLFGMFPYFFTVMSHIIITIALALLVIGIVLIYGFWRNGFGFLKLFVPQGVPLVLAVVIVPIEVLSFISRPISLSVRLFANMLAGHITLKVFAGFIVSLSALGFGGIVGSILPLAFTVALTALEFLVAFLQAYVFAILTCMYLNDAIHPSH